MWKISSEDKEDAKDVAVILITILLSSTIIAMGSFLLGWWFHNGF